ncbi:MAG: hypothetical protein RLZZ387_3369 [Chloroflexota bacterium]|jgi:hypothetical protein
MLNNIRFDWRWVALIALIILVVNSASIPWYVTALALATGGGYLLYEGWLIWRRYGGAPSRSRVTYWRGQRYEVRPTRRGPTLPDTRGLRPAGAHLFFGGILALAALAVMLRAIGL